MATNILREQKERHEREYRGTPLLGHTVIEGDFGDTLQDLKRSIAQLERTEDDIYDPAFYAALDNLNGIHRRLRHAWKQFSDWRIEQSRKQEGGAA